MELIAKLNNEDKINLQFVKEDREYFYNRLYQDISGKVLERIEQDVKTAVGREVGTLLASVMEKYMETMVSNIHNTVSESLCKKLDAIIEQEKTRIKQIPFIVEYKVKGGKSFSNEAEAVRYLRDMYILSGYKSNLSKDHYSEFPKKQFPEYAEALRDMNGIPDLIVWNDIEAFFVEAKLMNGIIQMNQILWYANHPKVKSIVCIVGTDNEVKKLTSQVQR